jgi:hypothetical protein
MHWHCDQRDYCTFKLHRLGRRCLEGPSDSDCGVSEPLSDRDRGPVQPPSQQCTSLGRCAGPGLGRTRSLPASRLSSDSESRPAAARAGPGPRAAAAHTASAAPTRRLPLGSESGSPRRRRRGLRVRGMRLAGAGKHRALAPRPDSPGTLRRPASSSPGLPATEVERAGRFRTKPG